MIFLFANFVDTTLEAALPVGATSAWVPPSASLKYPQPGVGEVVAVTLQDGYQEPEIVYVTSNPHTGEMVLLRGQEGTSEKAWPVGSLFTHTLTKASILWFSTGGASDLIAALQAQINALQAQLALQNQLIDDLKDYVDSKDGDLHAEFEQASASITTNAQAIATANYAMAQINTTLTASVSTNTAQISTTQQVIATNQSAQATINQTLSASINGVNSSLTNFQQAQATQNGAFATSLSTLTANYGNQQSQITNFQSAQVTQNGAFTTSINNLTTNYNNQQTQITAVASTANTLNGNLSGRYVISISAGQFASLELAAGSGTSNYSYFALNVSKFLVSDPTGTYTPFKFDTGAGVAYLDNIKVRTAVIDNLAVTSAKIANLTIANDKVVYNTITDRLIVGNGNYWGLSTSSRTTVESANYSTQGGELEILFSLTCVSTAVGDSYPQVFIVMDGSDILAVPWYIKGGTQDAREISVDVAPSAGPHSFSVRVQLAPGSGAAHIARARMKISEFIR